MAGCASEKTPAFVRPLALPAKGGAGASSPPADACPKTERTFTIPIAVTEDLGVARHPPMLGFPFAFSKSDDVHSLEGFFAATADGTPLPSDLEVLSRWGDGPLACDRPIRWAYAHVLADVPKKARSLLSLRRTQDAAIALGPTLEISETKDQVTVDTGPARFTLSKDAFFGLSSVVLEGGRSAVTGGEMILVAGGARYAPSSAASIEIERRGPHLATIAVKGTYARPLDEMPAPAEPFRFTARFHFFAGTAAVKIDHTYYNGALADETAHGGEVRALADRIYLRLPLAFARPRIVARAAIKAHAFTPKGPVGVAQHKRTPSAREVLYAITEGDETIERGSYADEPMLAATSTKSGLFALATIAHLGPRDPQALRFDPKTGSLEVDWQSEPMHVGGARGIWSAAMIDFGDARAIDLLERGRALYAFASRPLIGIPPVSRLDAAGAGGGLPDRDLPSRYRLFDDQVDRIHDTTAAYIRKNRITGVQIWPDLPRSACRGAACEAYFEGGDSNYWDWSKVELDEFLRTGDPGFLFDFAVPEAITMAETISFRTDHASSFAGFSPCYGGATDSAGVWREGLNHRTGTCPGDYSYNKVHALAYVLTADRRFADFFTEGAETAVRLYGDPDLPETKPRRWLELSASRTTYQYLQPLLDAAEFGRLGGDAKNRAFRDRALRYFEHMRKRALERGHVCDLLGTGADDPKALGECKSDQAWMLPVWIDWVARLFQLYEDGPARDWLLEFAARNKDRQKTVYRCLAGRGGIQDDTCRDVTDLENGGGFYPNGRLAYLNALGIVLDAVPDDPLHLCDWLPGAYARALSAMDRQTNGLVWGKELGQAYAFAQTALGAIQRRCRI